MNGAGLCAELHGNRPLSRHGVLFHLPHIHEQLPHEAPHEGTRPLQRARHGQKEHRRHHGLREPLYRRNRHRARPRARHTAAQAHDAAALLADAPARALRLHNTDQGNREHGRVLRADDFPHTAFEPLARGPLKTRESCCAAGMWAKKSPR